MSGAHLWSEIASFSALCTAARCAARGKRRTASVALWLADLEPNALRLERELETGTWRPGRPTTFEIHDPKLRTITAAPFEDRVVHHALMDRLEPLLERGMVRQSFACRRGKGTHAALRHARGLVRRFGWFLKLDVQRCFDSIRHDVALRGLAEVTSDERALELAGRIVHAGGNRGRGLPIGNLTSQWLANLVLSRLDHFVLRELATRGYVRYMDDFVLFGEGKAELRAAHGALERFLAERLDLALKARATILAPCRTGLPFLGWRIHRGTSRLRPPNLRRTRARLARRAWQHRQGRITDDAYRAAVRSVFEHLRSGDTRSLGRRMAEELEARAPPGARDRLLQGGGPPAPQPA